MKIFNFIRLTLLFSIFFSSLFFCQKREFKNPYDPKSAIEPTNPLNLTTTIISDTQIKLQWEYKGQTIGFKIERKDSTKGKFRQLAQIAKDSTSYIDTNLKTDIHYYYRVKAFTASSESYLETDINHVFPVPTNLNATQISDTLITLTWHDSSIFETGFNIERKIGIGGSYNQIGTVGANIVTFSDSQIQLDTKYFYQVKAFTHHNQSNYSNECNLIPYFPVPENLQVTSLSSSSLQLSWNDNCTFEDGYHIKYVREGQIDTTTIELDANTSTYEINNLDDTKIYFVSINAYTQLNNSDILVGIIDFIPYFQLSQSLTGHGGYFLSFAFSSNDKWLASSCSKADGNPKINIWGTDDWSIVQTLTGHSSFVLSVAFSPDGQWLASGGNYENIKIWSTSSWSNIQTFDWTWNLVESVEFSPDGQWLASGSRDNAIKIWSTNDWRHVKTLTEHSGSVQSIAFSPDGQWLASGSTDSTIKIWSTSNWSIMQTLTRLSHQVQVVAISPNGQWLASWSLSNTVKIWSTANWDNIKTLNLANGGPVSFSPNGEWLAVGGAYYITIFRTVDWFPIKVLNVQPGSVHSIAFSHDGQWLVSGGAQDIIEVWNA